MLGLLAVVGLLVSGCSGGTGRHHARAHGQVVAFLPIPYSPPLGTHGPQVMSAVVTAGQRFSVKVDTSDGPIYWAQSGAKPDPRLVRQAGDVDDGHCPKLLVGCRVPFFSVLVALRSGTTTMTWTYHALDCPATPSPAPAGRSCQRTSQVVLDIKVIGVLAG